MESTSLPLTKQKDQPGVMQRSTFRLIWCVCIFELAIIQVIASINNIIQIDTMFHPLFLIFLTLLRFVDQKVSCFTAFHIDLLRFGDDLNELICTF